MKVVLSQRAESAKCRWCEKDRECVTATFSDGFLKDESLCWKCLQMAFRVRSIQAAGSGKATEVKSEPA